MSKNNTWREKVLYIHKNTGLIDRVIGILIFLAFIAAATDLFYRYRPMKLVEIDSPVILSQESFKLGDIVYGTFDGEVFTDEQPRVTRFIVCKNNSYELTDRFASGGRRKLSAVNIAITRLDESDLKLAGVNFTPDTDCFIQFTNIYSLDLPISGTRTEQVRYFSDTFDIVE